MVAKATSIIGDNQNATNWAVEKMISDGNRHIDIMYMKIRERVAMGEIAPEWIKGKINSRHSAPLDSPLRVPAGVHPPHP